MSKHRLSQDLIDQIGPLYLIHKSTGVVSRLLGISEESARKYAHLSGVQVRGRTGMPRGPLHPEWRSGRRMDKDGYILISCALDHPGARKAHGKRQTARVLEHRVFAEIALGRNLTSDEVVDHIDGCKFHNDPSNLRVFSSNAEHLKATISGQAPKWSEKGSEKIRLGRHYPDEMNRKFPERIDTHRLKVRFGDERRRQILLGHELLGTQSLWFLGMQNHFERIGIDWPFDQKTEQDLCQRYLQSILRHPSLKLWIEG